MDKILTSKSSRAVVRKLGKRNRRLIQSGDPHDLLNISAVEAARRIREGKLTSSELVKTLIQRIKDTHNHINSAYDIFEADALKEAKEVDEYLANLDKNSDEFTQLNVTKPLLGVPFSVKGSFTVKGKKLHCGLPYKWKEPPQQEDAVVVKKLRDVGAIPLAHTNIPSACIAWESDNKIVGRSSTPYDSRCTCGGSSGGEGALISSQGSIFGLGSDIGGSIRMPSMLNGLFGLKPHYDTIDGTGHFPPDPDRNELPDVFDMLGFGPICRYARDLPVVFSVLSGQKIPSDLHNHIPKKMVFTPGFSDSFPLSEAQMDAFNEAFEFVKYQYNLDPTRYYMPCVHNIHMEWYHCSLYKTSGPQVYSTVLLNDDKGEKRIDKELMKAVVGKSDLHLGAVISAFVLSQPPKRDIEVLRKEKKEFVKAFWSLVDDSTIYLFPGLPLTHYFHKEPIPAILDSLNCGVFNLLGASVVSIPMGLDKEGYPKSVQLVATKNNYWMLINLAMEMEKKFGGWTPPKVN
ncbi:unnamed protein product [Bursaphelenchus xylophilus]|uniref:(pine wood nematode) hypothetical protein n=1 Tax=Bursaphelenchus xylophilus TaxID=6326 RepID=A0A1I7SW45_BURXY|nr:unnamed protein product [Bursaphelenchus xylophilus]CAG9098794.1 unnamed protein product [Bursaphelenchus xylophilus]